jgi:aspartyl-tRNA(Asn)/glutamyl-tRNA(Gln) amidotransferase subunit C
MDIEQVQKLATLARLEVPHEELAVVAGEMGTILGFIDEIQNVDVRADNQHLGSVNVFRDDVITPIVAEHDLVEVAALHHDHFVKVPKVIGQ